MTRVNIQAPYAHGYGAHVVDADTGKEINGVSRLTVDFAADDIAVARIELCADIVEVEGAVAHVYILDPATREAKPIKSITFEDGSVWSLDDDAPAVTDQCAVRLSTLNEPIRKVKVGGAASGTQGGGSEVGADQT